MSGRQEGCGQLAQFVEQYVLPRVVLHGLSQEVGTHKLGQVLLLYEADVGNETDELEAVVEVVQVVGEHIVRWEYQPAAEVIEPRLLPQFGYLPGALVSILGPGPLLQQAEQDVGITHDIGLVALCRLIYLLVGGGIIVIARGHVHAHAVDRQLLFGETARLGICGHDALRTEQEHLPRFLGILAARDVVIECIGREGLVVLAQAAIERVAQFVLQYVLFAAVNLRLKRDELVKGTTGHIQPKFFQC